MKPQPNAQRDDAVASLYGEEYAVRYASLYLAPWAQKHRLNTANLSRILDGLPGHEGGSSPERPRWLDLACGQAWHFSQFPGRTRQVGVDLSPAQLALARCNAPDATLLHANVSELHFPDGSFDLVTSFWAAYCYLGSAERIAALVRSAIGWTSAGGALYFEVLLPRDLAAFNLSHFSARTGFAVSPLTEDYGEWQYDDVGGRHVMTSPPLEMFLDLLSGRFRDVEAKHDGAFMVHVIATGRTGG
jgi:SAM-dependent methyltransferase